MPYDRHRATNRWAIATALSVWVSVHALANLDGVTARTASLFAVGGLVLLPVLLVWPWIRRYFRHTDDEVRVNPRSPEFRSRTLISAEIVMLSALSMLVLMQISS